MKPRLVIPLLAVLLLLGCKTTPERVAFNTLDGIATFVDTGMKQWGEAVKAGQVTIEQRKACREHYEKYQKSMALAVEAFIAYKKAVEAGETNQSAYSAFQDARYNVQEAALTLIDLVKNWTK